jgi:hypothetical protein
VLGGNALPGQPCDDGNAATVNEVWLPGCLCDGTVQVDELIGSVGVAVRPNPTEENVLLILDGLEGQTLSYVLRDVRGSVLEQRSLGTLNGTWSGTVPMVHLAPGIYLLDVQSDADSRILRVVRQ